jgi:hypothetical protein
MGTYAPSEGDFIAYSDNDIFIVWNGSATFNVYDCDGWEIDVFTNYNIDDYEDAQGHAYDWADAYEQAMIEEMNENA